MPNNRIIIVAAREIFGPFPDLETAESWRETHQVGAHWSYFSIWDREMGNHETASSCGTKLESEDKCCQ